MTTRTARQWQLIEHNEISPNYYLDYKTCQLPENCLFTRITGRWQTQS